MNCVCCCRLSRLQWFEKNLEDLNQSFHSTLEARTTETNHRLDALDQRITTLDERLSSEKADILRQIDEQGIALNKLLNEFKVFPEMPVVLNCFMWLCFRLNLIATECCGWSAKRRFNSNWPTTNSLLPTSSESNWWVASFCLSISYDICATCRRKLVRLGMLPSEPSWKKTSSCARSLSSAFRRFSKER